MRVSSPKSAKLEEFLTGHASALAHQGVIVASYRDYRGQRLGPYYRLECRVDGRKVSVYLGPDGPLVAHARERLAAIRQPWLEIRSLVHEEKVIYRLFRAAQAAERLKLEEDGLRLQGSEIRGYRSSGYPRDSESSK